MNNTTIENKRVKYVVVRDNIRVSEKEYDNELDAKNEVDFWIRGIERYPDGTRVRVVQKDSRLHRTYSL